MSNLFRSHLLLEFCSCSVTFHYLCTSNALIYVFTSVIHHVLNFTKVPFRVPITSQRFDYLRTLTADVDSKRQFLPKASLHAPGENPLGFHVTNY